MKRENSSKQFPPVGNYRPKFEVIDKKVGGKINYQDPDKDAIGTD